jgi:hypothetical protein
MSPISLLPKLKRLFNNENTVPQNGKIGVAGFTSELLYSMNI